MAVLMQTRRTVLVQSALIAGTFLLPGCAKAREPDGGVRAGLYNCEGCEAVDERDPARLGSTTQIAGPDEPGPRLLVTGRVTTPDGTTPAAGVIIYAHHTNIDGLYANGDDESEWSRRNGRLRGWVKTDANGRYSFLTIKPSPYPDMMGPAHVHLMIGEKGKRRYYVDDVVFAGEFGVTEDYRRNQELRGGSGTVTLRDNGNGVLVAERDIILERHPG